MSIVLVRKVHYAVKMRLRKALLSPPLVLQRSPGLREKEAVAHHPIEFISTGSYFKDRILCQ